MPSKKEIALKFFTKDDTVEGKWICTCRKEITQHKNTGWTNLTNHVKSRHEEEYKSLTEQVRQTVIIYIL